MEIREIIDYLNSYDGRPLKLMEVCGTHTAAIFKNGIRELISPKIRLISGPGCPVCVTPTAYIDACTAFAKGENVAAGRSGGENAAAERSGGENVVAGQNSGEKVVAGQSGGKNTGSPGQGGSFAGGHELLTFGDMMKVPGKNGSLSENKTSANITVMYSPFEAIEKAKADPTKLIGVAAVGFETTVPAYALMLKAAKQQGIENIRLITALKTVLPALEWICENQNDVDGFICPGHVSVITGIHVYDEMAEKYGKPFVVAGFEAEHILGCIYRIVRQIETGEHLSENLYRNAVRDDGNAKALAVIEEVFERGPATWRGLGEIPESGLYLRGDYARYDGGSRDLTEDMELPAACRCGDVIVGRINPDQCPMFGKGCDPIKPYGPCMVSAEGSCGIWYRNVH